MKFALVASLAATATAFAPAKNVAKTSALNMSYENELGVLAPTGFFDPAGLSKGIDQDTFDKYRAAEIKHGRVAQLAVLGYVAAETYRFPFDISPGLPCSEVTNGVAAISQIPALGWLQIIALVGAVETKGWLRFDFGIPDIYPEELEKRQVQELQHGRLAMLAIAELVRHDLSDDGLDNLITGLPFIYK